jgi:hypothetical protein
MTFVNGSRIVALPGEEKNIRCFSGVRLLVIDEASRVPDELYASVRPMLAVSRGRLIALSTPWGQRGWLYEAWTGGEPWQRVKVTADGCPRITAPFLAEEKRAIGERFWLQEYFCKFVQNVGAVFRTEDVDRACANSIPPLFGGQAP